MPESVHHVWHRYNAFYLDCKMTPSGHMPGNILMTAVGILAATSQ